SSCFIYDGFFDRGFGSGPLFVGIVISNEFRGLLHYLWIKLLQLRLNKSLLLFLAILLDRFLIFFASFWIVDQRRIGARPQFCPVLQRRRRDVERSNVCRVKCRV